MQWQKNKWNLLTIFSSALVMQKAKTTGGQSTVPCCQFLFLRMLHILILLGKHGSSFRNELVHCRGLWIGSQGNWIPILVLLRGSPRQVESASLHSLRCVTKINALLPDHVTQLRADRILSPFALLTWQILHFFVCLFWLFGVFFGGGLLFFTN